MSLLGFLRSLSKLPADSCKTRSFRVGGQAARLKRCEKHDKIEYEVFRKGSEVAYLQLKKNNYKEALEVGYVQVNPEYREHRLGTKLYEMALKDACALGYEVESDNTRSAFAEAFWRKQMSKGRAECVTSDDPETAGGTVYNDPLLELADTDPEEHARVRDLLPRPSRKIDADGDYEEFWPCLFYSTTNACKTSSLAGVKSVQKRAKKRYK